MRFIKKDPEAIIPSRATVASAGYDLRALVGGCILPGCRLAVETGIGLDDNYMNEFEYLQVLGRGGHAFHHGIQILGGVIDADFEGSIKCILYNSGNEQFLFSTGDAIAQGVIVSIDHAIHEEIPESERGDGHYGSTGS